MLLKSIKLNNIRSYENQEITFPNGSVLLSGDIGCGKSTILLAIEFAIFGAKKGELPAYTLLRHGKKEGSVELRMQIENKDILIKRTLKRGSNDIKQEAGYVIINGIKKDGTSEELRAIVLEILGYPKDLIKKGKDMIYRYTVYTPQEEMKKILYESRETRLDTLRKVFNIDKYKTIKENAKILTSALREKKRHLEGFVVDLDYKKRELEERKKEILDINHKMAAMLPKIEEIKKLVGAKKLSIEAVEKEIKELTSLKNELKVAENNLVLRIEQNNRLNDEIKKLEAQIETLKAETEGKSLEDFNGIGKKIAEKDNEMRRLDENYKITIKKISECKAKIDHSNETIKKIKSLDMCPVCEQEVSENHKHDIDSRESKKHEDLVEKIRILNEEDEKLSKLKIELKNEIDNLMREQNKMSILKIKIENIDEKSRMKDDKIKLKETVKKEIGILNFKKTEVNAKIQQHSSIEERYKEMKKELDLLLPEERFLEIEHKKYETEKISISRFLKNVEKEIEEKQKAKEKINYLAQLSNWIDEMFLNLMSTMEKHVMVSIHSQFNDLFRNWFDILIEDEAINVRVDDEFTPIIEQNGYETYIENLSGGEKTSVALAYRLALNKVVNEIVAEIKTKDIIMLDEPTDGFSTEQLDKVRDVLTQLNMKQVIIVSHESKIEGFVENVIRVQKQDGVSVVV